jgi:hypothetical protein
MPEVKVEDKKAKSGQENGDVFSFLFPTITSSSLSLLVSLHVYIPSSLE